MKAEKTANKKTAGREQALEAFREAHKKLMQAFKEYILATDNISEEPVRTVAGCMRTLNDLGGLLFECYDSAKENGEWKSSREVK